MSCQDAFGPKDLGLQTGLSGTIVCLLIGPPLLRPVSGPRGAPVLTLGWGMQPRRRVRDVQGECPAAGDLSRLPTGTNLRDQGLEMGLPSVSHLWGLILEPASPTGLAHSTGHTPQSHSVCLVWT